MTLSIYLMHSFSKQKYKWYYYLIMFCGLLAIEYIVNYTYRLHATEYNLRSHLLMQETNDKREKKSLTRKEAHEKHRASCIDQMEHHRDEALKCYEEVERLCAAFPDMDARDKSLLCLKTAFAAAFPTTPTYRIFAAAIVLLQECCGDMWVQMQEIDTKLNRAKYHAEQYEHFRQTEKYLSDLIKLEPSSSKVIIK